jgi:hypothetical protein
VGELQFSFWVYFSLATVHDIFFGFVALPSAKEKKRGKDFLNYFPSFFFGRAILRGEEKKKRERRGRRARQRKLSK